MFNTCIKLIYTYIFFKKITFFFRIKHIIEKDASLTRHKDTHVEDKTHKLWFRCIIVHFNITNRRNHLYFYQNHLKQIFILMDFFLELK